ncbi:MAG TPA: phosphoribosylanthranilate isomerase [Gemmatimonadaceae bacterium]|nr:phosphoribosylanthranilate isomerase [Gemmatimonadaceae bacterium]
MPAVKFCGLRRAEDAAAAVDLGAAYVGVIFAGGPRQVTVDEARRILEPTRGRARATGVFGAMSPDAITQVVEQVGLDVVQLSADPDADIVEAVRSVTRAEVWAVVRCGATLPESASALFTHADAVLLDAKVAGRLGGTGHTLPWNDLAPAVNAIRSDRRLILAGGLTPDNVRLAIEALAPDVVDVSSGVESAPGIKDHERMRAFYERSIW